MPEKQDESSLLEDFNPFNLGRRSRAVLDSVWQQVTRISSPTSGSLPFEADQRINFTAPTDFDTPEAATTSVLVVGATGRVGRVLVRKLVLRGYRVRAMIRKGSSSVGGEGFPRSVEVVEGDVTDYDSCRLACSGVDKIVYAVRAKTTLAVDLRNVEENGARTIAKAFQDAQNQEHRKQGSLPPSAKRVLTHWERSIYDDYRDDWQLGKVAGVQVQDRTGSRFRRKDSQPTEATLNIKDNLLVFEGTFSGSKGIAEMEAPVRMPAGEDLGSMEGLVLRLASDGRSYSFYLRTAEGVEYATRFTTKKGFGTYRLPFQQFRPKDPRQPPLVDPSKVARMGIRCQRPSQTLAAVVQPVDFKLKLYYIKAFPAAVSQSSFIMISCAGDPKHLADDSMDAVVQARVLTAKQKGELSVRQCGLAYTIIRPGPLVEEPGGYRGLVFDQGNRITQTISYADVADICLKALHNPEAINKTFEVSYEQLATQGQEMYELVAHVPNKANNYLGPALATLEKNT
ncbi:hypothetical protein WJX84_006052 [Apatococcus fuscideae]